MGSLLLYRRQYLAREGTTVTASKEEVALGAIGLSFIGLLLYRRWVEGNAPQSTTTPLVDNSSIGPLIPGNILAPRPGENSQLPITVTPSSVDRELCESAPMNSFGPKCQGITWNYYPLTTIPFDFRTKSAIGTR